jgi:hypothetical protein
MGPHNRKGWLSGMLLLSIATVLLLQCTPDDSQERQPVEQRHPIESALLSNSTDAPVHDLDFSKLDSVLPTNLAGIAEFPEGSAIGLLDGDSALILGRILDAAIIPAEPRPKVALLDGSYRIARVFGLDGTPEFSFGGQGEGPGELTSPVALGYADGEVMILDAFLKIERYGWTGVEWEPAGRLGLRMDAQDLCPLGESLAVIGMRIGEDGEIGSSHDPRAVHLLSYRDQEITASFSAPYSYDGIMALWYMMRGKLACDSGRGVVWVAYESLGEVHALDLDGNLLWITRLTDMATPEMVEMEGEAIRRDMRAGQPVEIITHISLLDESLLAVQVWSVTVELAETGGPGERTSSYRTYFLDADSGLGVGGFRGAHLVIGGGDGHAILYREDPFPQFAVVRVSGG